MALGKLPPVLTSSSTVTYITSMRRFAFILPWIFLSCAVAGAQFIPPGFPPGAFNSRGALDAGGTTHQVVAQTPACIAGTSESYQTTNTVFSYTGNTISAGSNLALTLTVTYDIGGTTTPTVVSAIWDLLGANQSLTQVNPGATSGTQTNTETWALVNPTPGVSKTITVAISPTAPVFLSACAWTGVNQTGGATSFPGPQADRSNATVTVTSASGDIVLGTGVTGAAISGITGTTIYSDSSSGANKNAFSNYMPGAATVAIGQTNVPNNGIVTGVDIKAN